MRRAANAPVVAGGGRIFQRMFTRLGCQGRPPHFLVEFYPYADLSHTIRLRGDTACVRLSDLLRGAPLPALEAAAAVLLSRLYRRKLPRNLMEAYRRFSFSSATRRRIHAARRRRARPVKIGPRGSCHDLAPLYDQLNLRYFQNKLERPRLGWSGRAWRTQLGCFDPALRQIVINRGLDRKDVPEYVISYVLYHEMLHQKHPMRYSRCRLESHSAEFRREETRFPHFERARRFLERFV
jgi:hypothetical protein